MLRAGYRCFSGVSNRKRFRMIEPTAATFARLNDLQFGYKTAARGREKKHQRGNREQLEHREFKCFQFEASAANVSSIPAASAPEVAFAGRSNVGKSTLLNQLTQKPIAEVSNKPGQTQKLNFYQLSPPAGKYRQLALVDMPGYGFALAKEDVILAWADAMKHYLEERSTLRRLLVLLDGRHGMKKIDREFLAGRNPPLATKNLLEDTDGLRRAFLDASLPKKSQFSIVLTKCDLVSTKDLARRVTQIEEELGAYRKATPIVVAVSKKSPRSIKMLQAQILAVATPLT